MPNKDLLLQYANLKIAAKQIEEELDMLSAKALAEVQAIRGDTEQPVALSELPGCSFTVQRRKTWTYSGVVMDLEKHYKEMKKIEEQDGTATYLEKESLVFTTPKE